MRSGRGARLPGMGVPAAVAPPPAEPKTDEAPESARATPEEERASAEVTRTPEQKQHRGGRDPNRSSARRKGATERERKDRATPATSAVPAYVPNAGDTKIQVNPRIYRGTWRHYEQLVDELPRERRRGALTALINAVLAQHAPRDVTEARNAIAWLRRAEARDASADTREQIA
jgi:hypothetical protein